MRKELQLKKSLAQLGHGKWKSALGHTLLIIGMVLVSLGAYAQQHEMTPVPDGLVMEKKWQSDDPTGRTGNILVETFVTGHSVSQHVPTDIVLVLDVSGSMDEHLYDPVEAPGNGWTYNNYGDSQYYYRYVNDNEQVTYCPVIRYYSNRRYYLLFELNEQYYYLANGVNSATGVIYTGVLYEQQEMTKMDALRTSVKLFVSIIAKDAATHNVDHTISIVKYAMNNYYGGEDNIEEGDHDYTYTYEGGSLPNANYTEVVIKHRDPRTDSTYIMNQVDGLHAKGATAADYGLSKARYVLADIPEPGEGQPERSKVVVMFTDGSPTYSNGFVNSVADNAIEYAYELKHDYDATVFSVGVFDVETDNINTYMNYVSSNYPNAQSMTNGGAQADPHNFYFMAESAGSLSEIFKEIAGASGAMSLPTSAIVQDMVSPNFQLPSTATGTVIAYAPLCTDYDEETGEYTFEDINDAGTLTIGTVTVDGETITGVVTGGTENKLPTNYVTIGTDGKTIQMSGFNFSHHWCGWKEDDHGNKTIHGRKIVIKIPVTVDAGTWGDGIETNNTANSYLQVGDVYYGPFNNLTTNVMGDVWTEVVTAKPQGYNNMEIDTPEELAWFISEVNGRIHYNGNTNNVASNPSLPGRLTADIDMSAHNWVPIGAGYKCNDQNQYVDASGNVVDKPTVKLAYEGVFDGNGHVITGLKNNADKWYKVASGQDNQVVVFPGMFSNVKGNGTTTGIVHDVFILDADFRGKQHNPHFVHHGILADTLTGGKIYNCEAAGRLTCNNDALLDANLIYGGLVGLNNGGTIHSSMAMANLTGYTMGGAVGENRNGSFSNSFTNGEYHYIVKNGVAAKPVGGLVAANGGTIDNCYVRFERDNENLTQATFDMLVGVNEATYTYLDEDGETVSVTVEGNDPTNCYIPQIVTWSRPDVLSRTSLINPENPPVPVPASITTPADNPANSYTLSVNKTFYNMYTNDNMTDGSWIDYGGYNVYKLGTPLVDTLNAKRGNGAEWKRTTAGMYSNNAGDINDDFPVLQLPGYTCLASTNGITIDYATSLDDMLERHNTGKINKNSTTYSKTAHEAIYGGAINLFANDDNVTKSTMSVTSKEGKTVSTVVYIDENTSLLQGDDSSIEAYTGQSLQAFDNTTEQAGERYHNISSSLSNSQFGWHYDNNEQVTHNFESDPCGWNLNNYDEDYAFFPIDLRSYHRAEFYCFLERAYHWINFRRNKLSHWHMDNYGLNIPYNEQEDHFIPGKGYLTSVDMSTYWNTTGLTTSRREAQFLQNRGTLNNGNIEIAVTCDAPEWTGLKGYNLLGNPYQSYLDFNTFAWKNSGLWNDSTEMTYAIYDPSVGKYLQGSAGAKPSEGALAATGDINMHQGFFVKVSKGGTATFTNDMRSNEPANGTHFRGSQPNYPLVNLIATDAAGNSDIAVLEVGRPENGGAQKLRVGSAKGRISLRHDNTDFGILFRDITEGSQPLYFDTDEDGTFTLSWNTANANFSSLTLVDNLTGARYDMLANDSYSFEGKASDYRSRFKVVIGRFTDVEENEEVVTDNFAFFDGSDWIVNGQGQLTVTDMTGRTVYTSNLTNDQNRVSLNGIANGIYLMRVANGQNVNVQKIVVR